MSQQASIDNAIRQINTDDGPTPEEMRCLTEWFEAHDAHDCLDELTAEDLDSALREHRVDNSGKAALLRLKEIYKCYSSS